MYEHDDASDADAGVERRAGEPRREEDRWGRPVYSRGPLMRTLEAVSLVAGVCAVLALIATTVLFAVSAHRISDGRKFAVGVTCAVESAVSQAGYDSITKGSVLPETSFVRFLEAHGYPSLAVRQAQAKVAGQQYVSSLAAGVVERVGAKGARLIRSDGSLDCNALGKLSNVSPLRPPKPPKPSHR